jgi:hypothetical protein
MFGPPAVEFPAWAAASHGWSVAILTIAPQASCNGEVWVDFSGESARRSARVRPPRNYLSPSSQLRLLSMVAMLMLVLYAMRESRKPQTWYWLWGRPRVEKSNAARSDGEVSILPRNTADRPSGQGGHRAGRALDEAQLQSIRDDTVWRQEEQGAWFHLCRQLRKLESARLMEDSLGDPGYAALFRQPEVYRGRLVTMRGTVSLAYRVHAPDNQSGVREYCVFWVRPASGPGLPIVVYALETPPGFPQLEDKDRSGKGTELNEDMEFTGYFFKRWAYRSHEGISTAPLVLASVPRWFHQPPSETELPSATVIVLWISSIAAVSVLLAVAAHRYTRTRRSATRPEPLQIESLSEAPAKTASTDADSNQDSNQAGSAQA